MNGNVKECDHKGLRQPHPTKKGWIRCVRCGHEFQISQVKRPNK